MPKLATQAPLVTVIPSDIVLCVNVPHANVSRVINHRLEKGFTLIEIMVVVVILSVFAGMVSLSVGSSEVRKNRGFYEHFIDSMSYIRLLSAEQMTPMGIRLVTDKSGQITAELVRLDNAYISYQTNPNLRDGINSGKNAMELSASIRDTDSEQTQKQPTWTQVADISLPTPPTDVNINIIPLQTNSTGTQALQPWFVGQEVPSLLWFGTGQASPANIEITYHDRLVGEVIHLSVDGNIKVGSG